MCIIDESEVEKEERTTLQTSSGIFSRLDIILHPGGATPTTWLVCRRTKNYRNKNSESISQYFIKVKHLISYKFDFGYFVTENNYCLQDASSASTLKFSHL